MSNALPALPEPDAPAIFIHAQEGRIGPMSRLELVAKISAGELTDGHHFWFSGMEGWLRISDHAVLLEVPGAAAPAAPAPRIADVDGDPVVMGSVGDFSAHVEPGSAEDDRLDKIFGELVEASWRYFEAHNFASHIDEVFLGAIITSTLDSGCVLIDISSDGTHHYLRFEDLEDNSRIVYRMTHLTSGLTEARVQGQRASVVIGYGERVGNFQKIWKALQAEYKSGLMASPEPGTITVDGDMNSGYVYVQVDLFLKIDDYVAPDYAIDYAQLQDHLSGCHNALRKYLRGRFA
jgi:hypothetical protein